MASQTTVTGPITLPTLDSSALEGKFVVFTLVQAGTDDTSTIDAASQDVQIANGDFSIDLWVNGESGVESIYLIDLPSRKSPYQVIIPSSSAGGSITIQELIEFHQVDGSTPQQPNFLDEAKSYTNDKINDFAEDPSSFLAFDPFEWNVDLGIQSSNDGGQLGLGASASLGGAVGASASTGSGGAVGSNASSTNGFAGGSGATASADDAVQLGSGSNSTPNTIQFLSSGPITDAQFGKISDFGSGFVDYNDTTGQISLTADTWTDVPNNASGAFTNTAYKPNGVTTLIDTSTGYLDFSDLTLGSEILIRNDFSVNPQTNNALLEARYLLGTGAGEYQLLFWSERLDSGSGIDYQRVTNFPIYMGDLNTRDNPGKLQVRLSTSGNLTNAGSYISIRVK